jgi:hypothetical protein
MTKFRKTEAASPSRLSDLDYSPLQYKKRKESSDKDASTFMIFGSLVDCLLTEPSEFKNRYSVSSVEIPSDAIKNIITGVFNEIKLGKEVSPFLELADFEPKIIEYANYEQYGKSWKQETVVKKVIDSGSDYFQSLLKSIGKEIISSEDYDRALACVDTLKTHEFTRDYFDPKSVYGTDDLNIELHFQCKLVWKVEENTCKGILDLMIIDHINKLIIVIDLKTTASSVYTFSHSYIKFRYYLQGAMYYDAVVDLVKTLPKLKDYKICNPKFIVIEQNNYNPPFIYEMSDEDLLVGRSGGILKSTNKPINGYLKLVEDLKWHQDMGTWEYPKDVYLNKGNVSLNLLSFNFND